MSVTGNLSDHSGADFHTVLAALHNILQPASYLEIGTATGASLAQANCNSIAIDPHFIVDRNVVGNKAACHFFQMTSDAFFKKYDPTYFLGAPIELAFLDGLHYFEFLMRDFINVERFCKINSVIMVHDCLPTDLHVARRRCDDQENVALSNHPGWWAGDLWKFILILKTARPNLIIRAYNAPPTGLISITNLDPDNSILSDEYYNYVEYGHNLILNADVLSEYLNSMELRSTTDLTDHEMVSRQFWL